MWLQSAESAIFRWADGARLFSDVDEEDEGAMEPGAEDADADAELAAAAAPGGEVEGMAEGGDLEVAAESPEMPPAVRPPPVPMQFHERRWQGPKALFAIYILLS